MNKLIILPALFITILLSCNKIDENSTSQNNDNPTKDSCGHNLLKGKWVLVNSTCKDTMIIGDTIKTYENPFPTTSNEVYLEDVLSYCIQKDTIQLNYLGLSKIGIPNKNSRMSYELKNDTLTFSRIGTEMYYLFLSDYTSNINNEKFIRIK